MTVYELIKELTKYDADVEVRFLVHGNMDFDTVADFDRDGGDQQEVCVNVEVDDSFEFDGIEDWTRTDPKYIEINLEY